MSFGSTMMAAFAGLGAGVVIGLLSAPEPGVETRRKITGTADAWKHKARQMFGKGQTDLEELKRIFEQEVTGMKNDVRERILRLIEESKNTYQDLKAEASRL